MKNISIIVMALALLGVWSCKRSEKDEISTAADNAAKSALVAGTNWAITNGANLETSTQVLVAVEELSRSVKMAITNEVFVESMAAGEVLANLHEQDHLPGISKDEHGNMTSDAITSVDSNKAVVIVYPTSRTFHLVKNGETSTNNYILVKQSKDSEWKLQRAWETDSKGQIIQEWPVK